MIRVFFGSFLLVMLSCGVNHVDISETSGGRRESGISIESFGAIPNDGKDDSRAIQQAIDNALCSGKSLITAGPGIFDIQKGVVIAKKCGREKMQFATFHLIGHVPAYDSDQRLGETTVFKIPGEGFGLATQKIRNSRIENIVFQGSYQGAASREKIMRMPPGLPASNTHKPNCAIAIDPFHKGVPRQDRYSGYSDWYSYNTNSGSSMLTISNCSFLDLEVAIANNPSKGVNNGDNIKVENSHVKRCHTFWACGQTQSRGNTIENIYALNIHTFIDGRSIGVGQGTPPVLTESNLAGCIKYLFNLKSGFSGTNVHRTYMESVWSLGVSMTNVTSFDQCQIKFHVPTQEEEAPEFLLYSDGNVSFRDCSIEYFANCNYQAPFYFRSENLVIDGCHIEGGMPVSDGYTNRGGERLHNVTIRNSFIQCLGRTAGRSWFSKPDVNMTNDIILGGEVQLTSKGDTVVNFANTYDLVNLGMAKLKRTSSSQLQVELKNGKPPVSGANVYSEQTSDLSDWGLSQYKYRPSLGFVKSANGDKLVLNGVPSSIKSENTYLYAISWPVQKSTDDIKWRKKK